MTWRPGHACIEQEVRTLRHGETVDLTALYETYSDLLFRTALTYVSHSEDAQDVVHDVFAVYLAAYVPGYVPPTGMDAARYNQ